MSGLLLPGSELRYIFLAEIFFTALVRSFAAIKSCLGNAWHIEIIQHLSSHPISFLQSINYDPCSSIWNLRLHSETLSYAFDQKLGNAAARGALLTLHDVRTPWNFDFLKNLFSLKKSQMDQFQPNLLNVWKNAKVGFWLSSCGFQQPVLVAFQRFFFIQSCCNSINIERKSYFFHKFFRLLWFFSLMEGSITTR